MWYIYIYIYHHPETHAHTHAFVPIKLKKNQYIQCIKRMNVLKNAQNPLYFHTSEMLNNLFAWFCLLLSIHFIRPGLGTRRRTRSEVPQGAELLLSFRTTAVGARHSGEQDGAVNGSRQRGFLTVLPPTRVPAALPRTVIHALRWSQGCLQVSACRDTRYNLNSKTHSFLCKTSWIVKTNPQVQYKPIGKTGNIK